MTEPSIWTDFAEVQWPAVGERVRYTTRTARRGYLESLSGEGVVAALGAGIEPHFRIVDGPCVCPTLGDTWERIDSHDAGGPPWA